MQILLLLGFLFVVLSIVFSTAVLGISPMPSPRSVRGYLNSILPNRTPVIYELGSGWGGIAAHMAKIRPNGKVIGFEKSFFPWLCSLLRRSANLRFSRTDFYHEDLRQADCIYVYLFPKAMERLKEKLEGELKNGAVVISYVFAMPGWHPAQVYEMDDLYRSKLYIYTS